MVLTMKEIAAATGVSVATVSNAFNHPERLSKSKRAEILAAAESLGYGGPHPGASSLRTGTVGSIGFMITDWLSYAVDDPASTLLLQGIAHSSQTADTVLALLPLGGAAGRGGRSESERARSILQRAVVDGFIAFNLPDEHPAVGSVRQRGAPLVIVDAPKIQGVGWVGIDERAAAGAAAEHLLAQGHRRIGVLVDRLSPDGYVGAVSEARVSRGRDLVARERLRGYADAFADRGLPIAEVPIVEAGGYSSTHARRAAEILLSHESAVSAVLAISDVMAVGVLDICAERGIGVPTALSVVGFDDIPAAEHRGLTTVHQPLMDKGQWAAEMLFAAINGAPTGHLGLPWNLTIRETTGPPHS
ncbi:substrate-binding domain-containing protein [Nocardia sp. BMG51109]|uniref:LacI family DNA-binding transcriptional regulator n=1 Tax=Nocardia sp. BMG51109 TaxID=1056816 RepID=UPI0004B78AF0|nr:substrate-binding domain-containing protein [Nocardia sp. BMG51109]